MGTGTGNLVVGRPSSVVVCRPSAVGSRGVPVPIATSTIAIAEKHNGAGNLGWDGMDGMLTR